MQETNTAWALLCAQHCVIHVLCHWTFTPATVWNRHSNSNQSLREEFASHQRFKPASDIPKLGLTFHIGHFLQKNQSCRIDEKDGDRDGDEEGGVKRVERQARRNFTIVLKAGQASRLLEIWLSWAKLGRVMQWRTAVYFLRPNSSLSKKVGHKPQMTPWLKAKHFWRHF